jgi:TusA-related sulfurtransferase
MALSRSLASKQTGTIKMNSKEKPTEVLDVRGEVCPYPDVKTQKKTKSMKSGEILEVLIDYPLSAERIPRSMEKRGHKVLEVEKKGTSEWSIMIKIK